MRSINNYTILLIIYYRKNLMYEMSLKNIMILKIYIFDRPHLTKLIVHENCFPLTI